MYLFILASHSDNSGHTQYGRRVFGVNETRAGRVVRLHTHKNSQARTSGAPSTKATMPLSKDSSNTALSN